MHSLGSSLNMKDTNIHISNPDVRVEVVHYQGPYHSQRTLCGWLYRIQALHLQRCVKAFAVRHGSLSLLASIRRKKTKLLHLPSGITISLPKFRVLNDLSRVWKRLPYLAGTPQTTPPPPPTLPNHPRPSNMAPPVLPGQAYVAQEENVSTKIHHCCLSAACDYWCSWKPWFWQLPASTCWPQLWHPAPAKHRYVGIHHELRIQLIN